MGALRLWIPIDTLLQVASWRGIPVQPSNNESADPEPQQLPPIIDTRDKPLTELPVRSLERRDRSVPPLTPEQTQAILYDLYYNNRIPVHCNTPGVLRDNRIEGVSGYTVCFLPASN